MTATWSLLLTNQYLNMKIHFFGFLWGLWCSIEQIFGTLLQVGEHHLARSHEHKQLINKYWTQLQPQCSVKQDIKVCILQIYSVLKALNAHYDPFSCYWMMDTRFYAISLCKTAPWRPFGSCDPQRLKGRAHTSQPQSSLLHFWFRVDLFY